ncbi:MAG: S9 family peptidase [Marinilabiliales bacterium]|nr:MAG: S9 family peptidase [Marinilabiliales bacterium]
MKLNRLFYVVAIVAIIPACMQNTQNKFQYPETKKVDTIDTYFGQEVSDPYRWLEDDNSEETAAWVAAQNELTQAYLSRIPFRQQLNERLTEIWNYPKYRAPFKRGNRYFLYKNDGMQNQDVLYMMDQLDDEPEVLLDPNTLSEDGTVALSNISVSKDGSFLAFSISSGGSDWNEIRVMEIDTKKELKDHIKWVKFSAIAWKDDGFFYSAYDEPSEEDALSGQNRFHKIYYQKLGTEQQEDRLIFSNPSEPLRNFHAYLTEDEKFLIVGETESTSGNALYASPIDNPDKIDLKKIVDGFDFEYGVIDHIGDELIIQTNHNAPRGKIIKVDFNQPEEKNWIDLVSEKEEILESAAIAGGKLFVQYLKDASNRAYFYNLNGEFEQELELPGIGTITEFKGTKNDNVAFYSFTSFTTPSNIYTYDISSNTSKLYKASELNFNTEGFLAKQIFFESKDGARVPMFIVYKEGLELDGNNPTILYGYGGFNISLTPGFSISRAVFLEQGGIYVMVNLRGGGEYGEAWHEAGTKMNKQNVFDDFIYAAKYLIKEKYTCSEKLAIVGGSNGGLLVGAAMTKEPALFKVAIPIVGVMDMLRYHNFTIGWAWASDYGRSDESEEMFQYLLGYSPLHNIKEGVNYPATLAITADHDDRVVPAHTFKFISELQAKDGGENPILVRIETKAGHGAGKPTFKQIEEATDLYGFIMYELGMKPKF